MLLKLMTQGNCPASPPPPLAMLGSTKCLALEIFHTETGSNIELGEGGQDMHIFSKYCFSYIVHLVCMTIRSVSTLWFFTAAYGSLLKI